MPVSSWLVSLTRRSVCWSISRRRREMIFTNRVDSGEDSASTAKPMNVAHRIWL